MSLFLGTLMLVLAVGMFFMPKLLPKMMSAQMPTEQRERIHKWMGIVYYALGVFLLLVAALLYSI